MEVEILPGVTAATSGAALLGAPLTHDFAVISLSDRLTPWELILKRLRLAAQDLSGADWLQHEALSKNTAHESGNPSLTKCAFADSGGTAVWIL